MTSTRLYPPTHYDSAFRLKVPFFLWVSFIAGLLHGVCLLPPAQSVFGKSAQLLGDGRLATIDAVVLAVLMSSGFRVPDARPWMRRMWHGGRRWMIAAYAANAVLFAFFHWDEFKNPDLWYFDQLVIIIVTKLVLLAYLLRSRLVMDVFADFPEPADEQRRRAVPVAVAKRKRQAESLLAQLGDRAFSDGLALALRTRIATDADDADAWHDLGLMALHQDRSQLACELVQQAVSIDGANGMYLRNLTELNRRCGRLEDALRAGQGAVRLLPQDADAHYNLALAWAQAGRLREAEANYRAALACNPNHAHAWNNLGGLYRHVGDTENARRAFARALEIAPGLKEAVENLQEMKS